MVRDIGSICPHCNSESPRDERGHCLRCRIHYKQPVMYSRSLNLIRPVMRMSGVEESEHVDTGVK